MREYPLRRTSVCFSGADYERLKEMSDRYFTTFNGFVTEAIREGLADYERYCHGTLREADARRYLSGFPSSSLPRGETRQISVTIPRILYDRFWELRIRKPGPFIRVWVFKYAGKPQGFWEGRYV